MHKTHACVCRFCYKNKIVSNNEWTKSKNARTNDWISLQRRLGVILWNLFFCFFVFKSRQVESSLWIHLTSTIHASWENIVAFFLNFSDGWFWAHKKNITHAIQHISCICPVWFDTLKSYHFEINSSCSFCNQQRYVCAYVQLHVYFSATCKHQTTNTDTHLAW